MHTTKELSHLRDTREHRVIGPNRLSRWRRWDVDGGVKGVSRLRVQPVRKSMLAGAGRVRTDMVPLDSHCLEEEKQPHVACYCLTELCKDKCCEDLSTG